MKNFRNITASARLTDIKEQRAASEESDSGSIERCELIKRIGTFFFGLLLSFTLLHGADNLFAQDTVIPNLPTPPPPANQECITRLTPFLDQERAKFLQFIDQHFKNRLANSELIDAGLMEYSNYRARLFKKFYETTQIAPGDKTQIARLTELSTCENRLNTEFRIAQDALQSHVRGVTNVKRTTALVEKLQAINGKLTGMNTNIAEMKGYFTVMANKVPFFVQSCLKE